MTVERRVEEAPGILKQETFERDELPDSEVTAQAGRGLRDEGRVEDGRSPKIATSGTDHNDE